MLVVTGALSAPLRVPRRAAKVKQPAAAKTHFSCNCMSAGREGQRDQKRHFLWFRGTAPSAGDDGENVTPKGLRALREHTCASTEQPVLSGWHLPPKMQVQRERLSEYVIPLISDCVLNRLLTVP